MSIISCKAEIEDGWYIYSQYKDPESFIVSTAFYFEDKIDRFYKFSN